MQSQAGPGKPIHDHPALGTCYGNGCRHPRMRITGKFRAIQFDEKNKPTILLIEDTKEVVMMLKDYLELAGYQRGHRAGWHRWDRPGEACHPDLILMDIQMPRMDGFETHAKLRSDPDFKIHTHHCTDCPRHAT